MRRWLLDLDRVVRDGLAHIFIGGVLTKVVAFLSTIAIVRLISQESFAYLSYTDTLYSYVNLLLGMGMASALLRFGHKGDEARNRAYFSFAFKWSTIFQIIVSITITIVAHYVGLDFPQSWPLFLGLSGYPILYLWLQVGQSFLRVEIRNREYAIVGLAQTVIVLVLSVTLVLVGGVYGVIWARYIAILFVCLWLYGQVKRAWRSVKPLALTRVEKRGFIGFSWAMLIANLFSAIIPINESFLVTHLIRDEVVTANYKIAVLLPSQLIFITSSIIVYIFPKFAQMSSNRVWALAKRSGLWTVAVVGLISCVGFVLTPYLVKLLYGSTYSDAIGLARLFWIPYAINAGFRILPMNILPAIGHPRFNAFLSVASCVIHVMIDYYLILRFGIHGAVFAAIAVYLISGSLYWLRLWQVSLRA